MNTTQTPFLEVNQISKSYPPSGFKSLKSISVSLTQDQRIIGIVGENGCGKSTLLSILAGLLDPNEGEVIYKGKKVIMPKDILVAGHPEIRLVNQKADNNPYHSVFENLFMSIPGFADDDYKNSLVEQYITLCDLNGLEQRNHFELSGGQKQRLAIGCSLIQEPSLLLLDEPFANLDPINKDKMMQVILNITNEIDCKIIFVSHSPDEILKLADHAILMQAGEILQTGTPLDLYHTPCNEYVAQFMGKAFFVDHPDLKGSKTLEGKNYIRPEYIQVSEKGTLEGQVIKSSFQGFNYEIKLAFHDIELITFLPQGYAPKSNLKFDIRKP